MTRRIGIILPSSNTVVEPMAATALGNRDATAHFSRLGVFDVTLDPASLAQFTMRKHLEAAKLLADARVDVLIWGGTSATWLGIGTDLEWCEVISRETGIPATTSVLEMNRQLAQRAVRRIALVTPYIADVQSRIIATYRGLDFDVVAEAHHGGTVSNDYAAIAPQAIAEMIRDVATAQPEAILVMCTNMRGAACAAALEAETGLWIVDSAQATFDAGLRL